MARIAVVGTGYVGLTTGVCFAHLGHEVVCVDVDKTKIDGLRSGKVPIVEDGLEALLAEQIASERISFTTDCESAVRDVGFVFLCLPTPDLPDGNVDMSYVDSVGREIGPWLAESAVVVNKSTVPVGTTRRVEDLLNRRDVSVVSNPEFLREGNAVADFLAPSRVVVGGDNATAVKKVASLYERTGAPIIECDATSAETIKYAANAFLATKISFINSIANICEHLGADVRVVADAIGRDPRIGSQFLQPGPGFGGSCFPKDTIGLVRLAEEAGYDFGVLRSVIDANEQQLERTVAKVRSAAGGSVKGTRIAVWGLTFKANTDDRRHSPAVAIVRRLAAEGAQIVAYDPTAQPGPLSDMPGAVAGQSALGVLEGAAVLVVLTEWTEFREVSPVTAAASMSERAVVDARNLLDPSAWQAAGFRYIGIGF